MVSTGMQGGSSVASHVASHGGSDATSSGARRSEKRSYARMSSKGMRTAGWASKGTQPARTASERRVPQPSPAVARQ